MKKFITSLLFIIISSLGYAADDFTAKVSESTTADSIDLKFDSNSSGNYVIESSDDLSAFSEVESLSGTGNEISKTYSISGKDMKFYRVTENLGVQLPTSIVMVTIPAGSFTMGNASIVGPLADDHKPERTVNISAFQMSEAEITNEQYVEFLNAAIVDGLIKVEEEQVNPTTVGTFVFGADNQTYAGKKLIDLSGSRVLKDHDGDTTIDPENPLNQCWIEYNDTTKIFSMKDPQAIDWDNYPYETGESRSGWAELAAANLPTLAQVKNWPVNFIKWYGAWVFAQYYGYDLPTEAEWEYAAKGGQSLKFATDDGTVSAAKANYNENDVHPDLGHVVEVKSYAANPFGLYDLSGNVWEWCSDWYDPDFYTNSPDPDQDPVSDQLVLGTVEPIEGPSFTGGPGQAYNGDTKVKRGGSWNFHESTLESSSRERDYTWRGNDHFGFRIVKR